MKRESDSMQDIIDNDIKNKIFTYNVFRIKKDQSTGY